jgi:hypothetical protein
MVVCIQSVVIVATRAAGVAAPWLDLAAAAARCRPLLSCAFVQSNHEPMGAPTRAHWHARQPPRQRRRMRFHVHGLGPMSHSKGSSAIRAQPPRGAAAAPVRRLAPMLDPAAATAGLLPRVSRCGRCAVGLRVLPGLQSSGSQPCQPCRAGGRWARGAGAERGASTPRPGS